MDLTPRQADIILLVRNHRHLHGYPPSVKEMSEQLHLARGTIMAHIERLVKKGLLRRTPNRHRTLEVVEDAQGVAPHQPKISRAEKIQAKIDALRKSG